MFAYKKVTTRVFIHSNYKILTINDKFDWAYLFNIIERIKYPICNSVKKINSDK
jgi:hypothetical protein